MNDQEEEFQPSKADKKKELKKKKREEKQQNEENKEDWEKFEEQNKKEKEDHEKGVKQKQKPIEEKPKKVSVTHESKTKKSKPLPAQTAFKFFFSVDQQKKGKKLEHDALFELWKVLPEAEKKTFKQKADEDKERYEEEMKSYGESHETLEKIQKGKKDRKV